VPELRVAAVIFDMDGVVIDSGDIYAKHWRLWGDQHGIDFSTRIAAVHPGRPPVETIRLVAPGLDAEAESRAFNAALGADDGVTIAAMPGARELLESLPQGRWAIATSAFRDIAEGWLAATGLPRPSAFVTVDDIEHGKPAPDPYLLAAKLLGVDPARCVVVEDSPAGVQAGKSAGAHVLGLRTTHAGAELTLADYGTAGLETITAATDGEDIVLSWEPASD
jgi:sugar-phosphatase